MIEDKFIPRKNVLTDADLESLRDMLAEHPCKYPFTREQAITLVDLADSVDSAKKLTFKIVLSATILLVIGWLSKGFFQWMIEGIRTGVNK